MPQHNGIKCVLKQRQAGSSEATYCQVIYTCPRQGAGKRKQQQTGGNGTGAQAVAQNQQQAFMSTTYLLKRSNELLIFRYCAVFWA